MKEEKGKEIAGMTGKSSEIIAINKLIKDMSASKMPVLLEGETGVGKSMLAGMIHKNSTRAVHPFITISCGAMPSSLLENELFGHEKGAFTGADNAKKGLVEIANKGTLFIDEIGEMDMVSQAKILRVIEDGKFRRLGGNEEITVDVRIIAATNKVLKEEMEKGKFRQDLYYRLNVLGIVIIPLRERKEDISLLVKFFTNKANITEPIEIFNKQDIKTITEYKWPGNIRELFNFVNTVISFKQVGGRKQEMVDKLAERTRNEPEKVKAGGKITLSIFIDNAERQFLQETFHKYNGNKAKLAKELNISRAKLYRKLEKYSII